MTIIKRLASEASHKITREVAGKTASKAGKTVAKTVAKDVARTTAKDVARTAAKDVARDTGKKAVQTLGRDVLTKSAAEAGKQAADKVANPAFEAAMSAVREQLAKQGKYANLSGPLMEAVTAAATTEEALQVASLARKLSVQFNQANRGALLHALEEAATKSKVHEEAFATLAQVVRTRQEAYAMFSLAEKRKIVEHAVDRYMTVGGEPSEDLARKAIKLVKARFDQHSANSTIKRVGLMETIAEQVRTIANFLNKALS